MFFFNVSYILLKFSTDFIFFKFFLTCFYYLFCSLVSKKELLFFYNLNVSVLYFRFNKLIFKIKKFCNSKDFNSKRQIKKFV